MYQPAMCVDQGLIQALGQNNNPRVKDAQGIWHGQKYGDCRSVDQDQVLRAGFQR